MYEKNIKYNLISENSLFYKYKEEYLNFFKKLFLNDNSYVKQLFIETFRVLKEKYFIKNIYYSKKKLIFLFSKIMILLDNRFFYFQYIY